MAGVLEKRERRRFLDDTIPLIATITTHRMETTAKQTHAAYVIRVQRGPNPDDSWEVSHRYNDFYTLHQTLLPSNITLTLPGKKMFGNTERQFLLDRQQKLQIFLDQIMAEPLLCRHFEVKKFLDPFNYSAEFHEEALRNVSMFFRSEPTWSVVEPLKDIGWRIRKQYYLIASKTDHKLPKHMLSWCEPGPDSSLGEKEMEAAFRVLTDIKHQFILPPVLANYTGGGMMIVREFIPTGSLRDAINGQRPQMSVLLKYGQSQRGGLTPDLIAKYGRQVLEALIFLSEKGFPLGQVHAGNVLIVKGTCKLVDIENSLIGVPSLYRHHLIDIRRLHSHEAETVYSFGHMLYEMCTGQELKTATLDPMQQRSIPAAVVPVLQRILTPAGIKENFPTLSNLLDMPFFSTVHIPPQEVKPLMKVSSKLKEVLKEHISKMEARLHEEQRKVSQFKRLSKAKESVMSEEEKKKRRKMRKKQMSLQETSEPESYPTTTSLPRQNTIGTSGVTASSAVRSKANSAPTPPSQSSASSTQRSATTSSATSSKPKKTSSTTPKAPPPPSSNPPAPQTDRPPPSGERGALLTSIEGFTKGKLKRVQTNDRSAPKL